MAHTVHHRITHSACPVGAVPQISSISFLTLKLWLLLSDFPLPGLQRTSSLSLPSLTTICKVHSQSNPEQGVDRCSRSSSAWLPSVAAVGARLCSVQSLPMYWSNVESGHFRAEQSEEGGQEGGGRGGDRRRTSGSKGVPSRRQQGYREEKTFSGCFSLSAFFLNATSFRFHFLVCHSLHFISSLQSQGLGFLSQCFSIYCLSLPASLRLPVNSSKELCSHCFSYTFARLQLFQLAVPMK